ncbi:hypothetical protein [Oscillibacter sp.]|uniref:hypothetical protein n=1 Tax=Oscillibacter sp. TaxID=1945593 RepID=UPI002898DFEA|nr:hypothetical protein [Oscillibacter sp.]
MSKDNLRSDHWWPKAVQSRTFDILKIDDSRAIPVVKGQNDFIIEHIVSVRPSAFITNGSPLRVHHPWAFMALIISFLITPTA